MAQGLSSRILHHPANHVKGTPSIPTTTMCAPLVVVDQLQMTTKLPVVSTKGKTYTNFLTDSAGRSINSDWSINSFIIELIDLSFIIELIDSCIVLLCNVSQCVLLAMRETRPLVDRFVSRAGRIPSTPTTTVCVYSVVSGWLLMTKEPVVVSTL